jgi:hypothetical protein
MTDDPTPPPRRWLTEPVLVALIAVFGTIMSVTIPLIFVKVGQVHTLVNARSSAQDSTIDALRETVDSLRFSTASRDSAIIELASLMRATADTVRRR